MVLLLLCTAGSTAMAQVMRLAGYDKRRWHNGIQVGYTQSKFDFNFSEDDALRQTLQGATSYYGPGFHIAYVGDLALNRFIHLRTIPSVTLVSRNMHFSWEDGYAHAHPTVDDRRQVEPVYGELLIDLKFRSMRWRNLQPYVVSGLSYGYDLASMRKNRNNTNLSIIRLEANDLRYSVGVGTDVYLRYVKFAIEMKMTFGVLDLKVPDTDLYTASYDKLNSRTFMLGFTFEG